MTYSKDENILVCVALINERKSNEKTLMRLHFANH